MDITYARGAVYGFLLRPRWIMRHVVVLTIVGLFALAGVWQIHRLHERRAHNALVMSREREPEAAVDAAVRDAATASHRRVHVTGRYDAAREVVLLGRGNGDNDGNHVLTPLVSGGRAVIVDRGFVPPEDDTPPVRAAAPPTGTVTVHGELLSSERSPFGSGKGKTNVLSLIDIPRLAKQLPYPVAPLYVLLQKQSPPQSGELPVRVKPEPLTQGPHKSYAIQWFSFIVIGLVGYGAFIRREASREARRLSSGA
jgi:surfeit locus 1 family protein